MKEIKRTLGNLRDHLLFRPKPLAVLTMNPRRGKYQELTVNLREPIAGVTSAKIIVSREAAAIGLSREVLIAQCQRLIRNPFGVTNFDAETGKSIDPEGQTPTARMLRTINRLDSDTQSRIREPILIKGTGIIAPGKPLQKNNVAWEDLIHQYKLMRVLSLTWKKKASKLQQETLEFTQMYAVVTIGEYQFLFMKYFKNASRVQNLVVRREGVKGQLQEEYGFSLNENPKLREAFFPDARNPYISWNDFSRKLRGILGILFRVVPSRNILKQQQNDGGFKYIIVDQRLD